MRKILLGFILIFCAGCSSGQKINYNDSAMFYYKKGIFKKAIEWCLLEVEKNKHIEVNGDSAYSVSLNNLGFFYRKAEMYMDAETAFLKSKDIIEKKYGQKNVLYMELLANIGPFLRETGRYKESEITFKQSLSIYEELNKTNEDGYGITLNNLGVLYQETENFNEAEIIYTKAKDLRKTRYGESSTEYAVSVNNLAVLYDKMGNYLAAEPLYLKAIDLLEKNGDTNSRSYASFINSIGSFYTFAKEYKKAFYFIDKSNNLRRKISGSNSVEFASGLHNLAGLYKLSGNMDSAKIIYELCLDIRRKLLGESHTDYLNSLSQLGDIYGDQKKYIKADSTLKLVLQTALNTIGTQNLTYLNTLVNLNVLYKKTASFNNLRSRVQEQFDIERKLVANKLNFLSVSELMAYLKKRQNSINTIYEFADFASSFETNSTAYNSLVFYKGIGVQNFSSLSRQMEKNYDTTVIKIWKDYKSNKTLLNRLLLQTVANRKSNADSLTTIVNNREKELLRLSAGYRNVNEKLNTTWADVKNALKNKEVAIEYVCYKLKGNDKNYPIQYAALILHKNDSIPTFIKLCNENELINALKNFAYKNSSSLNKQNNTIKSAKSIYTLIWQPLEKYLTNTKTVYFSPDGLLHPIAFAAIPTTDNKLLIDKYKLVQLTSTREIALKDSLFTSPSSIVLFGGINYAVQNNDTLTKPNLDAYNFVYQQSHRSLADSFRYLPNTLTEVESIARKFESKDAKTYFFTGQNASESNFRAVCEKVKPQVIHFATHGFTLPDTASFNGINNTYTSSKNPLLRTGLVMAGGNNGWKAHNKDDEDDGILTGMEIASMQLPNTQLAVLSACETANGEIQGSEGVFGLQRAFKLAGVKYVMASLWQVPDLQTKEFMDIFYNNWMQNLTIQDAFNRTQQTMHKKYAPYYWGGFTLIH